MGNPTHYFGCYEYEFTWHGKQLVGAKYPNATNPTWTYAFEYNEDGLRQRKQVTTNGITVNTDYYYNGSVLIGMQRANDVFRFSYDAGGSVVSVNFNGTEYYYVKNAQGDIVKLIDSTGASVVEYKYDSWGKILSITGSLADNLGKNQPFRYRGYVYDWELGLYYLQSRYYDPTTGRFISADVLLSTGQGVLGHNCYAYCNDNPVVLKDEGGCVPSYAVDEADSGCNATYSDILKRRIKAVKNEPYYSFENWNSSNTDEKKMIIESFYNEVSKILRIRPRKLKLVTKDDLPPDINGQCCGDEIWILFDDRVSYNILKVVVHELRHAYQHDVCAGAIPHGETLTTIESWKSCISEFGGTYISPFDDKEAYKKQPIESDACNFADQFVR